MRVREGQEAEGKEGRGGSVDDRSSYFCDCFRCSFVERAGNLFRYNHIILQNSNNKFTNSIFMVFYRIL